MMHEDGCQNKPVGEDNSVGGINLVKRLLCGELLCGKRCFADILTITPLGIPLISFVGDFDDKLHWG